MILEFFIVSKLFFFKLVRLYLALVSFQQIKVSSNAIQLFMFMRGFPFVCVCVCVLCISMKYKETRMNLMRNRLKSITKKFGFKRNSKRRDYGKDPFHTCLTFDNKKENSFFPPFSSHFMNAKANHAVRPWMAFKTTFNTF